MDNFKDADTSTLEKTCKESIVKLDNPWHIVCFILCVVIPGSGTLISALMDKKGLNVMAFIFGILQFFLTGAFGIGWIWSIIHGFFIFDKG